MVQRNKIVIAGTGRAGTTFLVQLLTELGLETGFNREDWGGDYFDHCNAGLERHLTDPHAPRIVKNPALTLTLPELWREGKAPPIEHILIPIRDLQSAAGSRARIGGDDREVPGGLWLTTDPERQADALAVVFHEFIYAVAQQGVPFTCLAFPQFATDPDFCFSKLRFLLPGITPEDFRAAFHRCARPELIHKFSAAAKQADPQILASYKARQAEQRRARRRRRWQRIATSSAAMLITLGAWYLISQHR